MKSLKEIRQNLGCLVVAAGAALGLSTLAIKCDQKITEWEYELRMHEPKEDDFKNYFGAVVLSGYDGHMARDAYIRDEDSDGHADLLHDGLNLLLTADGHTPRNLLVNPATQTMTAEIRDAATTALKADQRLSYLLARRHWELFKQEQAKKGNE